MHYLIERIEQAINRHTPQPLKLEIKLAHTEIETPAKQQQQKQAEQQAEATASIKNDDQVQKIMDLFNATLDVDSIKTI